MEDKNIHGEYKNIRLHRLVAEHFIKKVKDDEQIKTILNLINKQKKEIEHWKDETAKFINKCLEKDKEIEELKKENKQLKQCNKNLVAEIEYLEEK